MKQLSVDSRLSSESDLEHDRASMSPNYIKRYHGGVATAVDATSSSG